CPPGGMEPSRTRFTSRLFSGDPFSITGPFWLPRRRSDAWCISSPAIRSLGPWQDPHFAVKTGRTSRSNCGGPLVFAPTAVSPAVRRNTRIGQCIPECSSIEYKLVALFVCRRARGFRPYLWTEVRSELANKTRSVPVLNRALQVLELIAASHNGIALPEIAR